MIDTRTTFKRALMLGLSICVAFAVGGGRGPLQAAPAGIALAPGNPPDASSLNPNALIMPDDLVKILRSPHDAQPLLIHVGFRVLYSQGHIPGSEQIGPATEEGTLAKLRKRVQSLPRGKFIVLYCGCCPWVNCPNVKPAYEALHSMGFTHLKVLFIANNLGRDWINRGFPTVRGE